MSDNKKSKAKEEVVEQEAKGKPAYDIMTDLTERREQLGALLDDYDNSISWQQRQIDQLIAERNQVRGALNLTNEILNRINE